MALVHDVSDDLTPLRGGKLAEPAQEDLILQRERERTSERVSERARGREGGGTERGREEGEGEGEGGREDRRGRDRRFPGSSHTEWSCDFAY